MGVALQRNLRDFIHGPPGYRFQQRFEGRQRSQRGFFRKVVCMAGGILVMAVGLLLGFMPGPGALVFLLGAALIAEESLLAARVLDRAELRFRKLAAMTLQAWQQASPAMRVLMIALVIALAAGGAIGAYMLLFST